MVKSLLLGEVVSDPSTQHPTADSMILLARGHQPFRLVEVAISLNRGLTMMKEEESPVPLTGKAFSQVETHTHR